MKAIRWIGRIGLGFLAGLGLLVAVSVTPVDDTPYQQTDFYRQTQTRLARLPLMANCCGSPAQHSLRAGWAKATITPSHTTATGGYGERLGKHWHILSDSIFARAIVLDNGGQQVAIVGVDLVIFPPTVAEALKTRLPDIGLRWENLYVGAIHSHNSMGGWAPKLVGQLIAGNYDPALVTLITDGVLAAIRNAQQHVQPIRIGYTEIEASDLIKNRLDGSGPTGPLDGSIHVLKFQQTPTGQSAVLCSFSGHPTLFNGDNYHYLSRDYPGSLVDRLERKDADFALFLAGAVGSTAPVAHGQSDFGEIRNYAGALAARIEKALPQLALKTDSTLQLLTLPLSLREPNPRIADGWRLRPWVFYALYGRYPSELKALRIGNTVLLGTPCDFSGELAVELKPAAQKAGVNLMVTSFDGGYIGYITPDRYYHRTTYETRDMNWFGPQNGAYFKELMTGLLVKMTE